MRLVIHDVPVKKSVFTLFFVILFFIINFNFDTPDHKCFKYSSPQKLENPGKVVLVTGAVGFIGMHLSIKLKELGFVVIGYDNINSYYSTDLKQRRLDQLKEKNIVFVKGDICDESLLKSTIKSHNVDRIIHLAAQAGVRYSLTNPHEYISNNIDCFVSILEVFHHMELKKNGPLIYASSSSVYGLSKEIPFSESNEVNNFASLYAATKRANENIASTYHHLYKIPSVGLRFFTVYGPWGRPDMAAYIFTNQIEKDLPIQLNNYGNCERDFTYIDDIVNGIVASFRFSTDGTEIFNLGGNRPVELNYFVELIEKGLGKTAKKVLVGMQKGDVPITYANIDKAGCMLAWKPKISIEKGMEKFIEWFRLENGTRYINATKSELLQ